MTQVITIKPDGSITGLDHKKKGLDLRKFGKANIKRVTLIEWHEENQMWFIYWADNPNKSPWSDSTFQGVGIDPSDQAGFLMPVGEEKLAVCFMEYEDAVDAEVAVIQAMQLKGEGKKVFG